MVNETFVIRFFWGSRRESSEECAARLVKFLRRIGRLDPALTKWYREEDISNPKFKPIRQQMAVLAELLKSGIYRKTLHPYKPMRELGFRLNLETFMQPNLVLHCGCYTAAVKNSIFMNLPVSGPLIRRMIRVPFLVELCKQFVECWEPDRGAVYPSALDEIFDPPMNSVYAGWLTYVAHCERRISKIRSGVKVVPIGELGNLIIATPQRFRSTNADHVERIQSIWKALNAPMSACLAK